MRNWLPTSSVSTCTIPVDDIRVVTGRWCAWVRMCVRVDRKVTYTYIDTYLFSLGPSSQLFYEYVMIFMTSYTYTYTLQLL